MGWAGPPPVKDGAHPRAVGAIAVDVQPGGQEDAVLHGYGAVGEGGDEQLVPACGGENTRSLLSPDPRAALTPTPVGPPRGSSHPPKPRFPKWAP